MKSLTKTSVNGPKCFFYPRTDSIRVLFVQTFPSAQMRLFIMRSDGWEQRSRRAPQPPDKMADDVLSHRFSKRKYLMHDGLLSLKNATGLWTNASALYCTVFDDDSSFFCKRKSVDRNIRKICRYIFVGFRTAFDTNHNIMQMPLD